VFIGGTFSYRYGTTVAYGTSTPSLSLQPGVGAQPALATLSGLAPQTTYHAQLVLTTADGTATSGDVTFTTSAASPPPNAPVISGAKLTHRSFRVAQQPTAVSAKAKPRKRKPPQGTTLKFTLSTAAKLKLVITHTVPGLRSRGKCVVPTKTLKHRHAKPCQRTLTVGTLTRAHESAGTDGLAFSGRIGHRALQPGGYKANMTASNTAGSSKATTLSFTILT
jgi:hypothetical protein